VAAASVLVLSRSSCAFNETLQANSGARKYPRTDGQVLSLSVGEMVPSFASWWDRSMFSDVTVVIRVASQQAPASGGEAQLGVSHEEHRRLAGHAGVALSWAVSPGPLLSQRPALGRRASSIQLRYHEKHRQRASCPASQHTRSQSLGAACSHVCMRHVCMRLNPSAPLMPC
jgi:hypothetical protein